MKIKMMIRCTFGTFLLFVKNLKDEAQLIGLGTLSPFLINTKMYGFE